MFSAEEKNKILRQIAESKYQNIDVDLTPGSTYEDKTLVEYLIADGVILKGKAFKSNSRVSLSPNGLKLWGDGGYKD